MLCNKCGNENFPKVIFCIECGNQLKGTRIDYNDSNKKYFNQSIVLIICLVLIILSSFSILDEIPFMEREYLFNGLLFLTTLIFAALNFKEFIKLFGFTPHIKPFLQIFIGAPLFALLVVFVAKYMNILLGFESSSYFEAFLMNTSNMYLYGLLFVAVMPGFIEEFLFRGILFNHLLKLANPKITILVSGILFAFIHFSILSIFWLALIGLFLGYLRFRYRTIWYSIFFHVFYNASIFLIEIFMSR